MVVEQSVFERCRLSGVLVAVTFFLSVGVADCDDVSIVFSLKDLFDIVDDADEIELVVDAIEHCCRNSLISGSDGGAMRDIICSW